eukprot:117230_1
MNLLSSLFKGGDDNIGLLPPGTNININNRTVKIIQKIGEGGFATVYSAKDNKRKYAVKHCKCQSSEQIGLIDNEISIMEKCATLDHPNIVSYYGTFKKEFQQTEMRPRRIEYFILLEYMDSSLIKYIQKYQQENKIIPEKQIFILFLDIINATHLLHAQNPPIAHRDIKIDNILIKHAQNNNKNEIRLKLCDFGSCVNGTPKICYDTQQINIESELIERFTTPSYRSPEMIDLYQRKELSTKVDIWALGCVLFLLCYFEHPFGEGAKMSILDAKYKIPNKEKYSKKITKIFKMCFNKDPIKRPTTKQLSDHLCDIISGGKGILSSKYKKRSNSNVMKTQLHLAPKKKNMDEIRRKSLPTTKEEVKIDIIPEFDQDWDPFQDDNNNNDNNIFDDNFDQTFQVNGNGKQNGKTNALEAGDNDPFFSNDFSNDFFADNNNNNKSHKIIKKRKSKPKPIDTDVYNEHKRQNKRKKKKEKPTRSRSKSPTHKHIKIKDKKRPLTPQPKPQNPMQKHESIEKQKLNISNSKDPTVVYGEQLAQLISMGFNDTNKNIKAILRAKGNIQVAVSILIGQ